MSTRPLKGCYRTRIPRYIIVQDITPLTILITFPPPPPTTCRYSPSNANRPYSVVRTGQLVPVLVVLPLSHGRTAKLRHTLSSAEVARCPQLQERDRFALRPLSVRHPHGLICEETGLYVVLWLEHRPMLVR